MHLEKIPLVAAAIQTSAPFRVADELKLCLLQLEGVAKGFGFQLAGVEQELVGGDGEQGLGQLPHPRLEEILYILAGQYQQRVFLPVTLHQVADVFNGCQIGEEQVQLIQRSHIVAGAQQGVGHVGEDGEEQGVPQAAVQLHDALDPNTRNLSSLILVWPLKYFDSAPLHME